MASFEFGMGEFEIMLSHLADPEPIAKKMLEAATPMVKEALVGNTPEDTGDLKKSIRVTPVLKRNDGWFRAIRPTGINSRGERNMDVAAWKNYGTSKMPPEYFIEGAVHKVKEKALDIMEETFYKEVGAD